jgi:hypothetical protein
MNVSTSMGILFSASYLARSPGHPHGMANVQRALRNALIEIRRFVRSRKCHKRNERLRLSLVLLDATGINHEHHVLDGDRRLREARTRGSSLIEPMLQ